MAKDRVAIDEFSHRLFTAKQRKRIEEMAHEDVISAKDREWFNVLAHQDGLRKADKHYLLAHFDDIFTAVNDKKRAARYDLI